MSDRTFVIVGGGLAAAKAAEALRDEGFDGRVVLLGEEDVAPYERPPLSKDYLRGDAGRDAIWAQEEGWYDAHDVELRTSTKVAELGAPRSESCSTAASASASISSCSRPAPPRSASPSPAPTSTTSTSLRTVARQRPPARRARAGRRVVVDRRGLDRLRGGGVRASSVAPR